MSEWDEINLTERERQLEAELRDLGPVMREAARSRAEEADPAFLTALRARLVEVEPASPDPAFQRRLRNRLVGDRLRFRGAMGTAVGVALAAALALLLVLHPLGGTSRHRRLAVGVPQPTTRDLTRGYPLPGVMGGGGGPLSPTLSRAEGPPGMAYPTRLHLTAGPLPSTPESVTLYRLASSSLSGPSLAAAAHRFGIGGSPFCISPDTGQRGACTRQSWKVVAANLFPSRKPLHSLAVSPAGELIYHDLAYDQFAYKGPPLPARRAASIARAWLRSLGWPEAGTPVLSVRREGQTGPLNASSPIAVAFGWNGRVRGNVAAATLWVAPTGQVVEAHVWPPIARARSLDARNIDGAWNEVERGRAPIAVEGTVFFTAASGSGSVVRTDLVEVLVVPQQGPAYLEPAYRFSGTVRLDHQQGAHAWYALVPAITR